MVGIPKRLPDHQATTLEVAERIIDQALERGDLPVAQAVYVLDESTDRRTLHIGRFIDGGHLVVTIPRAATEDPDATLYHIRAVEADPHFPGYGELMPPLRRGRDHGPLPQRPGPVGRQPGPGSPS